MLWPGYCTIGAVTLAAYIGPYVVLGSGLERGSRPGTRRI